MKKIPTIFERDWNGDRSRVTREPNPACTWVFAGEGTATVKLDGTCVLVRDGKRFKRFETKGMPPDDFEEADFDEETGKRVGWRPVGDGPEDRWHREARGGADDGTYELLGPKIQGNPEGWGWHELVRHGTLLPVTPPPRDYDGLLAYLTGKSWEGLVFHHPDGRCAKIKLRDFGLTRAAKAA